MNEKMTGTPSDQKTGIIDLREQLNEAIWNELTNAERVELMNLFDEVDAINDQLVNPPYYFSQKEEDLEQTRLSCELRLKMERIEELLTGYPQTGSAASVVARRSIGHDHSPDFKLERRRHFFDDHQYMIWEREAATFGGDAISMKPYFVRDPNENVDDRPIILGHFRRDDDTPVDRRILQSYLLADLVANPDGESALQRHQPEGMVYLNGIGVHKDALGQGLGIELTDHLLAIAGNRRTIFSVKASNFDMMGLTSRIGKHFRNPAHEDGPHAGRSRCIELLYWHNYFPDSPDGDRVIPIYNPGLFIPRSIASVQDGDYINPREVERHIEDGRPRIAFANAPTLNSVNRPSSHFDRAVARLLSDGTYIGIPLGRTRLYVRVDSLPPRAARIIRGDYELIDAIRQEDYKEVKARYREAEAIRMGRQTLRNFEPYNY